ncbi:MAG: ABC-F family ATP-binding cassette domain-containing protein [Brevinema sp.]
MLQVSNLTKSYAHQDVLKNISFTIHKKEKVGLVGRNGHGKTTLFRMIAGLESPDSGTILFPKGYRVAYLKQDMNFKHGTIVEEVLSALPVDELKENWKAEKILFGLDFSKEMLETSPNLLSGGWMSRLNLAKVLISDADMLLLDEPTNHLDIITIHWLINFLKSWRKELLLVTHDRLFMDSVVTDTIAIHRKQIKKIKGNSEKLYEQIAQEEEIHEKTRINDAKEREKTEEYIRRFRAKTSLAGMVQSRIKSLEKKGKRQKLDQISEIDFEFNYKAFEPKHMISLQDLSFGYDPHELLIKDLSFEIFKGDRISIIGKNGKGKSTLLRLLSDKLTPLKGNIRIHPQLTIGYYGQVAEHELNEFLTIEEEIASCLPSHERALARSIAGAMLFEGPLALKKCDVLSGGEKARVLLGKLIATPTQCLFLDEPSNHLDMQSVDSLIEALDYFPGGIVLVTHNEMILHSIANRLIVFDGDNPYVFEGTYQEFLDRKGFSDEIVETKKETPKEKISQKDLRKEKAKRMQELKAIVKPLQDEIAHMQQSINQAEARTTEIHNLLIEAASNNDSLAIQNLSIENNQLAVSLDSDYEKLFAKEEELAKIQSVIN